MMRTEGSITTDDGFKIAWQELAHGDGGPPVLLQHGFSASLEREWVETGISKKLAATGRRIIGIDALGHGESDRPHDKRFYGEDRMASDISLVLDHLGVETVDLIGYSMGAVVSLILATREPRLRRLVVGGVGEAVVILGGVDTRFVHNLEVASALLADSAASVAHAGLRHFREHVDRTGDRLALAAHSAVVHARPVSLDRIAIPTLVIAGRSDRLAANPHVLVAAIPGARLLVLDGDHGSTLRSPSFVSAIVDFLQ